MQLQATKLSLITDRGQRPTVSFLELFLREHLTESTYQRSPHNVSFGGTRG